MNVKAIQLCSNACDELHNYVKSFGVCLFSPEFISKYLYLARKAQSVYWLRYGLIDQGIWV